MKTRGDNLYCSNRFSVSEAGVIGVSCVEKPSLSVIYPDANKSTVVLSNKKLYHSVTFMKVSGKEFLAAAGNEDGCLYLWDIQAKTARKAFDPKLPRKQRYKDMIICKINENTIGYGEVRASPDGSRRVFLLKTDSTEEWSLTGTLRFFTPHDIWDMCYLSLPSGTAPYLLFCMPYDHSVMAVEVIGGRTRWEVGEQEMGEEFFPWSICTDDNHTIYVTDYGHNATHLLSAEDASVITSVYFHHYGIANPFTMRIHDQNLYVQYYQEPGKYLISQFKKKV